MPLEPGPFGQAPATAVQFTAVNYGLADYATIQLAEVDTHLGFMDSLYGQMDDFGTLNDAVSALDDLSDVVNAVVTQGAQLPFPALDSMSLTMMTMDSQLADAVAFAPPQAWVATNATFVPPDPSAMLTAPTLDLTAYNPVALTPVGITVPGAGEGVTIFNTTRPGQSNFWVGDDFVVYVQGAPGADVTYNAFLQGNIFATADVGAIPENGTLSFAGQMLPDLVGAWREDWYINGHLVTSLNFVVLEAS